MNEPVAANPPIITLTTDFGPDSPYVAEMKGVIYSIHPQVTLVDATHTIAPQDTLQGSFIWKQISERFPAGTIHLAVVDPEVGSDRRLLLVQTAVHYLIAPDNGLFSQIISRHQPSKVLELDCADYWLDPVSKTFHGRDIMAPVAAHLSRGEPLDQLGTPTHAPLVQSFPEIEIGENFLCGEVIHIDGFGNLITNIRHQDWLTAGVPDNCRATCCAQLATGLQATYGDSALGTPTILFGSSGYLEFALVNGNAAQQLEAEISTPVRLEWSP